MFQIVLFQILCLLILDVFICRWRTFHAEAVVEVLQIVDVVGRSDCSIRKHKVISQIQRPVTKQASRLILIQRRWNTGIEKQNRLKWMGLSGANRVTAKQLDTKWWQKFPQKLQANSKNSQRKLSTIFRDLKSSWRVSNNPIWLQIDRNLIQIWLQIDTNLTTNWYKFDTNLTTNWYKSDTNLITTNFNYKKICKESQ